MDESLDVIDTAQLVVIVRMAFQVSTTNLKDRTIGEDIYNVFNGAPEMHGMSTSLCNYLDFPYFVNYHCVIHQQTVIV